MPARGQVVIECLNRQEVSEKVKVPCLPIVNAALDNLHIFESLVMDFLDELENMASNASSRYEYRGDSADEPSNEMIEKWQRLFNYSYIEASDALKDHRTNISRVGVTDEHWQMIREEQEALGYDREAYEHGLGRSKTTKSTPTTALTTTKLSLAQARAIYTIKLEGTLDTPAKIQEAARLDEMPLTIQGESTEDSSLVNFCRINGTAKLAIANWLSSQNISFNPTFTRIQQKALKDFHEDSCFPTLGIESTLPQFRAPDHATKIPPMQIQYPVWYFFYGALAQPDVLSRQLQRKCEVGSELRDAYILGGKLRMWGGNEVLVDAVGYGEERVEGMACEILGMEEEDALLVYETDDYEVVRCEIVIVEETVRGCTFRFLGDRYDS